MAVIRKLLFSVVNITGFAFLVEKKDIFRFGRFSQKVNLHNFTNSLQFKKQFTYF